MDKGDEIAAPDGANQDDSVQPNGIDISDPRAVFPAGSTDGEWSSADAGIFPTYEPIPSFPPERLAYQRASIVTRISSMVVLLIGITGSIFGGFLIVEPHDHPLAGSLTIAGSWLIALILFTIFLFLTVRWADRKLAEAQETRSSTPDENTINQRSIESYQILTQKQATSSYRLAQVAILAGLLILGGGVAVTVKTSGTTTQLVVGALTALGSTISGYVGTTSIRVYNSAISQMNFYYSQPLVRSYLLGAESFSQKLSQPDRKDAALEEIIKQTLESASIAANLIAKASDMPRSGSPSSIGRRRTLASKNSKANQDSANSSPIRT